MAIILWNKYYTETLAETLKRFRYEKPEFEGEKITYAGRLDPMAEGLLILLTGNDVHKKKIFLSLGKIYEVDFILGPTTDTYDILGVLNDNSLDFSSIEIDQLQKSLKTCIGKYIQEYPPYSSKPVDGKALFVWAREGKLDEIIIPTRDVEIFDINYIGKKEILLTSFESQIIKDISSVIGDFRQEKIIKQWQDFFKKSKQKKISIFSLRIHASSGTYMRSLVQKIAYYLGTQSCTVKIKRVELGTYKLE